MLVSGRVGRFGVSFDHAKSVVLSRDGGSRPPRIKAI